MSGQLAAKVRAAHPGSYDDLSDAELEAAVVAKYPGVYDDLLTHETASPSAPVDAQPTDYGPASVHERVGRAGIDALKAGAEGMAKLSGIPGFFREGPVGAIKDQFGVVGGMLQAQYDQYRKSKAAESQGRTSEMVGHAVASAVPVLGPMAARAGEQIASGQIPELIGEAGAGALMATIPVNKVLGKVADVSKAMAAVKESRMAAASAKLLAQLAKRSARPIGTAVGAGVGSMVGMPTAGALVGSEVGEMLGKAARKRSAPSAVVAEPVAADVVVEQAPTVSPRAVVDDPPPPSYESAPVAEPTPVVAPVVTPEPPATTPAKASGRAHKATKPAKASAVKSAAEQLTDTMHAKELARVRKALGTQDVMIARYEPRLDSKGKPLGVSDPVYVMPAEFVEQAQTMGLRARGLTALEKVYRSRRMVDK